MKLIVAGPPGSGKSVLIGGLKTLLEKEFKLFPLVLDATPDGETNFIKELYKENNGLAFALRKKGVYTEKQRSYISRCVSNSKHPLLLIDMGGKFNDNDKNMLKKATHAIIISNGKVIDSQNNSSDTDKNDFNKSIEEWTNFFKSINIKVIENIFSCYDSKNDFIEEEDFSNNTKNTKKNIPKNTLTINDLDRSCFDPLGRINQEALEKRPGIKKVAEKIVSELTQVEQLKEFKEVSRKENKNRRWEITNEGLMGPNTYDRPYEKDCNFHDIVYAGGFSSVSLAQQVIRDLQNGSNVHFLDSKLGEKIEIKPLRIGKTNRRWFDEPEYIGCSKGKKIYKIKTLANRSQNILLPEDLENLEVPEVPKDSIVKISNPGSQWFGALITSSYVGHCSAVGISMYVDKPKDKPEHSKLPANIIVWSKIDNLPSRKREQRLNSNSECVILDKPIVYIDMDGVLADFYSGRELMLKEHPEFRELYAEKYKNMEGLFERLEPIEGAITTAEWISENFNTYILTSSPWDNSTALQAKQNWIKHYFTQTDKNGIPFNPFKRKLIITHHKELLNGNILIDDRLSNGVQDFKGTHIWFGEKPFENWEKIRNELKKYLNH